MTAVTDMEVMEATMTALMEAVMEVMEAVMEALMEAVMDHMEEVMDHHTAEVTSIEVMKYIKALKWPKQVPIIFYKQRTNISILIK